MQKGPTNHFLVFLFSCNPNKHHVDQLIDIAGKEVCFEIRKKYFKPIEFFDTEMAHLRK